MSAKGWWMVCMVVFLCSQRINAECLAALGMTSRVISDSQITASSTYSDVTKPEHGRLKNTQSKDMSTLGGWCAEESDTKPYLQVDFLSDTVVWQIATQGLEQPNGNWVTKYAVNYSCDGERWVTHSEDGKQKVFTGNDDASSEEKRSLQVPVIARFIRIVPLEKKPHGLACLRVEMYGCKDEKAGGFTNCNVPVGMEDGRITGAQVTASSYTIGHVASNGRLNHVIQRANGSVRWGAWCTDKLDTQQYLQIDMGSVRQISGVATQGYNKGGWVTEYKIYYSLDGKAWDSFKENDTDDAVIFDANWDTDSIDHQRFDKVLVARHVRFKPVKWSMPSSICMRVEVYECIHYPGCSKPSSTVNPHTYDSSLQPSGKPRSVPTQEVTEGGRVVGLGDSSAHSLSAILSLIWVLAVMVVLVK